MPVAAFSACSGVSAQCGISRPGQVLKLPGCSVLLGWSASCRQLCVLSHPPAHRPVQLQAQKLTRPAGASPYAPNSLPLKTQVQMHPHTMAQPDTQAHISCAAAGELSHHIRPHPTHPHHPTPHTMRSRKPQASCSASMPLPSQHGPSQHTHAH